MKLLCKNFSTCHGFEDARVVFHNLNKHARCARLDSSLSHLYKENNNNSSLACSSEFCFDFVRLFRFIVSALFVMLLLALFADKFGLIRILDNNCITEKTLKFICRQLALFAPLCFLEGL